jgi:predicted nucleotide-binding protein
MARQSLQPPQRPQLNNAQRKRCIDRFSSCIADLKALDISKVSKRFHKDPEVAKLRLAIQDALSAAFGDGTPIHRRYESAAELDNLNYVGRSFNPYGGGVEVDFDKRDAIDAQKNIAEGIPRSVALLEQAIATLEHEITDDAESGKTLAVKDNSPICRKVFVVHGRDDLAKNEVARFLNKIGLDEIILHERPNKGRHLLTKFQEESEGANFAVVVMTPDDLGGLLGGDQKGRARQNVIFELGFFVGKLGLSRVVALVKGDLEVPSDFDGIVYVPLDNSGAWKFPLAKELRAANVPFDSDALLTG